MTDDAQKEFLKKYKKNIREMIRRYKNIDDAKDSVIRIGTRRRSSVSSFVGSNKEPDPGYFENISFLKAQSGRRMPCNRVVGFEEVYQMLCRPCCFEDVARFMGNI